MFVFGIVPATFMVMIDQPTGKELLQLIRLEKKIRVHRPSIRLIIHDVNRADKRAAGSNAVSNAGKKIALQVIEIADQIEGSWLDDKLAMLQIGDMRVYLDSTFSSTPARELNSNRRGIDRRDVPAKTREINRMASGATGNVERATGCEFFGGFD